MPKVKETVVRTTSYTVHFPHYDVRTMLENAAREAAGLGLQDPAKVTVKIVQEEEGSPSYKTQKWSATVEIVRNDQPLLSATQLSENLEAVKKFYWIGGVNKEGFAVWGDGDLVIFKDFKPSNFPENKVYWNDEPRMAWTLARDADGYPINENGKKVVFDREEKHWLHLV